MDFHFIALLYT